VQIEVSGLFKVLHEYFAEFVLDLNPSRLVDQVLFLQNKIAFVEVLLHLFGIFECLDGLDQDGLALGSVLGYLHPIRCLGTGLFLDISGVRGLTIVHGIRKVLLLQVEIHRVVLR